MKILLVNPRSGFLSLKNNKGRYSPMGIISLISVLKKDFDVEVFDFNIEQNPCGFMEKVAEVDVVGWSCFMDTFLEVKNLSSEIKKYHPKIVQIAGGPFTTSCPELYLKKTNVDNVLAGEGEISFTEMIKDISLGKKLSPIILGKRVNLNYFEIDFADERIREILFCYMGEEGNSQSDLAGTTSITTTRGCPWGKCKFCNSNYLGCYREKCLQLVKKELGMALENLPSMKGIFFWDADFCSNKKRAISIARLVGQLKRKIKFLIMAKTENLDEEILESLSGNGCCNIAVGYESSSDQVLKKASKGQRTDARSQIEKINLIKKYDIQPIVYVLIGLPGDTIQSLEKTIIFVKEIDSPIIPNFLLPIPGTAYFDEAVRTGKIGDLYNYVSYVSQNYQQGNIKHTGVNLSSIPDEILREKIDEIWEYRKKIS